MSKQHINVNSNSNKIVIITKPITAFTITDKDGVLPKVMATLIHEYALALQNY
jgi:hypothetical protein